LARLVALYEEELARYRVEPENARLLSAKIEDWLGPAGAGLKYEGAELAAWWVVGNVVLNLDETLTRG
jgi:hypothetical protein